MLEVFSSVMFIHDGSAPPSSVVIEDKQGADLIMALELIVHGVEDLPFRVGVLQVRRLGKIINVLLGVRVKVVYVILARGVASFFVREEFANRVGFSMRDEATFDVVERHPRFSPIMIRGEFGHYHGVVIQSGELLTLCVLVRSLGYLERHHALC